MASDETRDPGAPVTGPGHGIPHALAGRRILIVEDERLVAEEMRACLADHGAVAIGPATTIAQALTMIACEGTFDAAVLDLNLGGTLADEVADRLAACDVPYVIVSGYGTDIVERRHAGAPRVEKPLDAASIVLRLAELVDGRG